MWWEIVPYLATASALTGSWFQARFNVLGWWLHVVGTLLWVTYALAGVGEIHFAAACAIYLPFEIYGILEWNRKRKEKNE